ncbi:hypothetical protein Nepgr_002773 [Nepenthes gracilis]|uniref:RING-type domain-containing protein n=1 Tax=Nepenthes gracilis TaxID=150966 RepID=A0AAD3RY15_NEPGR|nr:hypothetical protein Nepgr_002773 [Nepenthes gracilis]
MEPPECPVCLQSYNGDSTIPRVLACGHSACESCLNQLPHPQPPTIRCPACTQLVRFPHPQGAAALPKNIDLLRLSRLLLNPNSNSEQRTSPQRPKKETTRGCFTPPLWSHDLYSAWKDWVLPEDAVLLERSGKQQGVGLCSLTEGKLRINLNSFDFSSFSPFRCRLVDDRKVGILKVGRSCLLDDSVFNYSYVGRVMSVLAKMSEDERSELSLFLSMGSKKCHVSEVYGLWFDVESQSLYLVIERKQVTLSKFVDFSYGIAGGGKDGSANRAVKDQVSCMAMIGVELCEVLIGLQLEGLLCGCLGLSCIALDEFEHVYIDLSEVVLLGRKIRKSVAEIMDCTQKTEDLEAGQPIADLLKNDAFVSPDLLFQLLHKKGVQMGNCSFKYCVDCGFDVWSLACILLRLIIGKQFTEEMVDYWNCLFQTKRDKMISDYEVLYVRCVEKITAMWNASVGIDFMLLQQILCKCLDLDPSKRPHLTDVWKSMKSLTVNLQVNNIVNINGEAMNASIRYCLVLGELCSISNEISIVSKELQNGYDSSGEDFSHVSEVGIEKHIVDGLSVDKVECVDLQGHLASITGLSVGGGFLFSSSLDKTIKVWCLKDFTHVHTFRGHEHRVMAVAFVDEEQPLFISGDSGGGICIWAASVPFGQEPLRKWYEQQDWRYSGIHALAVSGAGILLTGSGDRLIKAWSLVDYTLSCSMEGHKSVVSALAVSNAVLYSASWDSTVRLWCLHDYSPLAVIGEDMPGTASCVLSLYSDQQTLVAVNQNGYVKIWMNDVLQRSIQVHSSAIFALCMEEKWLFTGGLDKTVKVQEIYGDEFQIEARPVGSISLDSVITALLCIQGKLFVGCANGLIKVYHH